MSQLKDLYSPHFYDQLSRVLTEVLPDFQRNVFLSKIFVPEFESMELKQRMRHTTMVLHRFMPADFREAVPYLYDIIQAYRREGSGEQSLVFIFLPDYIEQYGLDHWELSVQAIEFLTVFITCEYAVRPFLERYYDEMMQQFLSWTDHKSEHVRRLASEGSRPRLPWAMGVQRLKRSPQDILPILERLKADPSEYVRRSVANNLNDISKDHPELIVAVAKQWTGLSAETDALVRHASRGLLKQGHHGILEHYGLDPAALEISCFTLHTPVVAIGDALEFSFIIQNTSDRYKTARIEYGIYYLKANGSHARKVFKISERELRPGEKQYQCRKQSFRIITTRVFYPGQHRVSLIVNGSEQAWLHSFELRKN